jgi:hypothetical protein
MARKTTEELEIDAYMSGDIERANLIGQILDTEHELHETQYKLEFLQNTYGLELD